MTTLQDHVLNHRCPNCGVEMESKPPKTVRDMWWSLIGVVFVALCIVLAAVSVFGHHYDRAAWLTSLAVFIVVVDR